MLADWLAQQGMGLLTQLLMAIGCTKEECLGYECVMKGGSHTHDITTSMKML